MLLIQFSGYHDWLIQPLISHLPFSASVVASSTCRTDNKKNSSLTSFIEPCFAFIVEILMAQITQSHAGPSKKRKAALEEDSEPPTPSPPRKKKVVTVKRTTARKSTGGVPPMIRPPQAQGVYPFGHN